MDGEGGKFNKSAMVVLVRFSAEIQTDVWQEWLLMNPTQVDALEHDVCDSYQGGPELRISGIFQFTLQIKSLQASRTNSWGFQ